MPDTAGTWTKISPAIAIFPAATLERTAQFFAMLPPREIAKGLRMLAQLLVREGYDIDAICRLVEALLNRIIAVLTEPPPSTELH